LPVGRPADLVIGVSRFIVPKGETEYHRAELSENESACRANLAPGTAATYACLKVTAGELDDLWREFRRLSFNTITAREAHGLSPHFGARTLWLRWGGRFACKVGDSSEATIEPAREEDFSVLMTAVETVGRKHL
jgi:hypothetical protein